MKCLNSIALCIAFVTIGQFNCQAQQPSPAQTAYRLTQESYITPEMQWAALSLFDAQDMTVNIKTGAVQGIQSINFMLDIINKKLENSISFVTKEIIKNAAHAMLEATEIAIFVATIEAAYSNQKYIMYQEVDSQLSALLTEQKNNIQGIISRINGTVPYDQPATTASSYFSWFSTTVTPTDIPVHAAPVHFQHNATSITIPANLIQAIIKKNDYKQEPNATEAAELLFKECFMAQQHHLKDRGDKIKITLHSPVDAHNYIFTHFPNFHHVCEIAKKIVPAHHKRTDLQAPVTQEQAAAHKLFLDTRQAIQTALYIANVKSSYNVGYILPASVTSYLNGVVSKLLEYDTELDKLCKDAQYGAIQDDIYRDEQWAMITKLAAGTVVATAVTGGLILSGGLPAIGAMITGAAGGTTTATTATGVAALTTAQRIWDAGVEAKKYTDYVGKTGNKVAKVGALVSGGATMIKSADARGYISLNDIDPNARYIVDVAQKVGTGTTIIGGTGSLIGATGNAIAGITTAITEIPNSKGILWSDDYKLDEKGEKIIDPRTADDLFPSYLYNKKSVWSHAQDAYNYSNTAINSSQNLSKSAQNAIGVGTVALGVANQLIATKNTESPQYQQPQTEVSQQGQANSSQANQASAPAQIPVQTITMVFTKLITDGVTADGIDPLAKIVTASKGLLNNGQTTPAVLAGALQNVEQNIQKTATPEITQGLNEIKQHVIHLANSSLQAAQQAAK